MGDDRDATEPQDRPGDAGAPLETPPLESPAAQPVIVPRWIQLVAVPLAAAALWLLARAAGRVLLLFIVAGVVALILNPVVSFVQRRVRAPRGVAIFGVYIGLAALVIAGGFMLANPVANQVAEFRQDVPGIIDQANEQLANLQRSLDDRGIDVEIKAQGETALQTLQDRVVGGTSDIVDFGGEIVRSLVTASLGLVLIIVISVYMLFYAARIGAAVRSALPPGDGTPEDDYPTRLQRAVAGYVRAQVLFSLAMGTGAGIGLYLYGVLGIFPEGRDYAIAFGLFFGVMELVPFVGPILGALPPILVALFSDPLTAVWVTILFIGLQQIEGHIVAPLIFGRALRINPLFVIFALLVGHETYGIIGALVALPLAAITRETVVYLRRHLVLEPWSTGLSPAVLGPHPDGPQCPSCGARAGPGDAFCRECGDPLGTPRVASRR